jgi:two-component system chemotaxis response regulator CheB
MPDPRKIRVLVVDDSAIVRKILTESISSDDTLEVVATAPDPIIALEKINRLKPDVLTLDIEMPRMDGLTFLKNLMQTQPMPVILISSLAQSSCEIAMEALRHGAVDVLAKPSGPYSVGDLRVSICTRIRAAAHAKIKRLAPQVPVAVPSNSAPPASNKEKTSPSPANSLPAPTHQTPVILPAPRPHRDALIAIGASTGGTEAIAAVMQTLPAAMPPILITQHIPPVFSTTFAQRLNRISQLHVREAKDGEVARPGEALVAPGGFHMILTRSGADYIVRIKEGPLVQYQKPSVDVTFASVAHVAGKNAIGVLLTGMGKDGAEGLLAMKRAGAHTLAQDEATCVIFGMPREAIRMGAADHVVSLDAVSQQLIATLNRAHAA